MKIVYLLLVLSSFSFAYADSDILWKIVGGQCLSSQLNQKMPAPCEQVNLLKDDLGYGILKDRNGPLQYLLIPTIKLSGIESPLLLDQRSQNYFFEAWKARSFMMKKFMNSIPDDFISLTVNSPHGRTQNQLHIHISCTDEKVKKIMNEELNNVHKSWTLLSQKIMGHSYYARLLTPYEFENRSVFSILAEELKGAKEHMDQFGLGVVLINGQFVLLASPVDFKEDSWGSVEEIQDHKCPLLFK